MGKEREERERRVRCKLGPLWTLVSSPFSPVFQSWFCQEMLSHSPSRKLSARNSSLRNSGKCAGTNFRDFRWKGMDIVAAALVRQGGKVRMKSLWSWETREWKPKGNICTRTILFIADARFYYEFLTSRHRSFIVTFKLYPSTNFWASNKNVQSFVLKRMKLAVEFEVVRYMERIERES